MTALPPPITPADLPPPAGLARSDGQESPAGQAPHAMDGAHPITKPPPWYFCPGETHPISRAVHLARMAAFYPKCRECPLNCDTGQLPRQTLDRLQQTVHRNPRQSLFTDEGLRGVYLNEVDRNVVERVCTALAGLLWEQAPLQGRAETGLRRRRPVVVIGRDERPSGPDLVVGVSRGFRRMGCDVVDLGTVTRPLFWFAAEHLRATGGALVTGAGGPPSWTGLDFVVGEAHGHVRPVSRATEDGSRAAAEMRLEHIDQQQRQAIVRPTRQAGSWRTFDARIGYTAGLWKHFHGLRPLTVCAGVAGQLPETLLRELFQGLAGRLRIRRLPVRARKLLDAEDADLDVIRGLVLAESADLGLVVDEDGQRCAWIDEKGKLVSTVDVALLLAESGLDGGSPGGVVLESGLPASSSRRFERLGRKTTHAAGRQAAMAAALDTTGYSLGCDTDQRVWLHCGYPTSDAILTLAGLMASLSRSDAAFSARVARLPE